MCLLDPEEAKNTAVHRQRHIFRAALTFHILLLSSPCDTRRNIPGDTRWLCSTVPERAAPRAGALQLVQPGGLSAAGCSADISQCDINKGGLEQGRELLRRWGEGRTSLRRGTPRSVRSCPACSLFTPVPKRCSAPWQQPLGSPTHCCVGEQLCSSLAFLGHLCPQQLQQRLAKDTRGPGVGSPILTASSQVEAFCQYWKVSKVFAKF